MKKYFYLSILFFSVTIFSCYELAVAEQFLTVEQKANFENTKKFREYFYEIDPEYAYYAHRYDDGSYFPEAREQEILTHVENQFLKDKPYPVETNIEGYFWVNPLNYSHSLAMAKLLLRYGGNPFHQNEIRFGSFDIGWITRQKGRKKIQHFENHNEVIKALQSRSHSWSPDLPSDIAIDISKLFLGLGVDMAADAKRWGDTLRKTLHEAQLKRGRVTQDSYIKPDNRHSADDLKKPEHDIYYKIDTHFYRSPVTYWLEEFIESGYSAEILETHKLHYPRFMKGASVEDVKDMLDNPKAHAIKTNINCNYDKDEDEDETALICPLTPSINMRDAMGRTPLHIAGNEGNEDVFNYLRNNGADASIMDYRGNSPTL